MRIDEIEKFIDEWLNDCADWQQEQLIKCEECGLLYGTECFMEAVKNYL